MTIPTCVRCKRTTQVRLVIEDQWVCSRCAYENEVGDPDKYKKPRQRAMPLQKEVLFPWDGYA